MPVTFLKSNFHAPAQCEIFHSLDRHKLHIFAEEGFKVTLGYSPSQSYSQTEFDHGKNGKIVIIYTYTEYHQRSEKWEAKKDSSLSPAEVVTGGL